MKRQFLVFILISCWLAGGMGLAQSDTELFGRAKVLLFDRKWDEALDILEQFIGRFPKSGYFPLALLYRSRCLEEKKMYLPALDSYKEFLKVSPNDNLKEEAQIAIIDLHNSLYQRGSHSHINRIIEYLQQGERTVRYYAAFKLSYIADKKIAARAVPVLKRIIASEEDDELKDRAKIALMRIDPDYLKEVSRTEEPEARLLHIETYDKKLRKTTFSLVIPFMFARLALESIPQEEKSALKKKGYNLDSLLKKLKEQGELLKFDDEESVFKIWVD